MNRNPADHFLHTINRDFLESDDVEANIQKLVKQYASSRIRAHVQDHVQVWGTAIWLGYKLSSRGLGCSAGAGCCKPPAAGNGLLL